MAVADLRLVSDSREHFCQLKGPPTNRPLGAGFLEALIAPNTSVTFNPVKEINATGIKTTDGKQHDFDLIICATGFDIGFIPFFELKGKNGLDITETWNPEPKSVTLSSSSC